MYAAHRTRWTGEKRDIPQQMISLRTAALCNIADISEGGELVAFDPGPDGRLYMAFALKSLQYREDRGRRGSFAVTQPKSPQSYRIVGIYDGEVELDLIIHDESFNIHHVQPWSGSMLLVCSRSSWRSPQDVEANGRVYSKHGQFAEGLVLGDGINAVQSTQRGVLWTSYFDEGVFGNLGWMDPIGSSGLVAWSATGEREYEFSPALGLELMCDCYALNVVSDTSAWCYYYADFPLVHIHEFKVVEHWKSPVEGSAAFAVDPHHNQVLFAGAYDDKGRFTLCELLPRSEVRVREEVEFVDGQRPVRPDRVAGRGSKLWVLAKSKIYQFDVATVARAV